MNLLQSNLIFKKYEYVSDWPLMHKAPLNTAKVNTYKSRNKIRYSALEAPAVRTKETLTLIC
jgi:hypothetical protein